MELKTYIIHLFKDKAYEKELEKCTAVHRPHH